VPTRPGPRSDERNRDFVTVRAGSLRVTFVPIVIFLVAGAHNKDVRDDEKPHPETTAVDAIGLRNAPELSSPLAS
jgi:hypothetical protein